MCATRALENCHWIPGREGDLMLYNKNTVECHTQLYSFPFFSMYIFVEHLDKSRHGYIAEEHVETNVEQLLPICLHRNHRVGQHACAGP